VATNDEAALAPLRAFLAAATHGGHAIDQNMASMVESDLVAARAQDSALGQADFHRWLTLARLASTCCGDATLTPVTWRGVRDMEHAAAQRRRVV
jgi:hypothetical protein